MSKKEVTLKHILPLEQAAEHLLQFANSMKMGKIFVQKDEDLIEMTPTPEVHVEIKAKRKKEKEKFSISVSWAVHDESDEGAHLNISSSEPDSATDENEGSEDDPDEDGEDDDFGPDKRDLDDDRKS